LLKSNLIVMRKRSPFLLLTIFLFAYAIVGLFSCQKEVSRNENNIEQVSKFFSVETIKDADIKTFALEIMRQNEGQDFLKNFIQHSGYLLWNDAQKQQFAQGTIALIPFALEGLNEINGFVIAAKDLNHEFRFTLFNKALLLSYGFSENSSKLTASKVQTIINYFNNRKFNISTYRLNNPSQLPSDIIQQFPNLTDKSKLLGKFRFRNNSNRTGENCIQYWEETEWWWDPDGEGDPCDCSGNEYYVYSTYNLVNFCWEGDREYLPPDPTGGSGTTAWWQPGIGGGGGYGGSGASVADEFNPNLISDPDSYWWDDNTTSFPAQNLPSWTDMNANYPKNASGTDDMPAADVYTLVGGTPLAIYNGDPIANANACALRVSRALNYSGVTIPYIPDHTFQGTDGKYYFLGAAKLYNWMSKTFGSSGSSVITLTQSQGGSNGENFASLLSGNKGIYIMKPVDPSATTGFGATGHCTLFDGNDCIGGHNYFGNRGGVSRIRLWILN
jgi:hypothetical protein